MGRCQGHHEKELDLVCCVGVTKRKKGRKEGKKEGKREKVERNGENGISLIWYLLSIDLF